LIFYYMYILRSESRSQVSNKKKIKRGMNQVYGPSSTRDVYIFDVDLFTFNIFMYDDSIQNKRVVISSPVQCSFSRDICISNVYFQLVVADLKEARKQPIKNTAVCSSL